MAEYWHSRASGVELLAVRALMKRRATAATGLRGPGTMSWCKVLSRIEFFWLSKVKVTAWDRSKASAGALKGSLTRVPSSCWRQKVASLRRNWVVRVGRRPEGLVYSPTRNRK